MIINLNKNRSINLNSRRCGDYQRTYIVLEAGPTFNDFEEAKRMVVAAKKMVLMLSNFKFLILKSSYLIKNNSLNTIFLFQRVLSKQRL